MLLDQQMNKTGKRPRNTMAADLCAEVMKGKIRLAMSSGSPIMGIVVAIRSDDVCRTVQRWVKEQTGRPGWEMVSVIESPTTISVQQALDKRLVNYPRLNPSEVTYRGIQPPATLQAWACPPAHINWRSVGIAVPIPSPIGGRPELEVIVTVDSNVISAKHFDPCSIVEAVRLLAARCKSATLVVPAEVCREAEWDPDAEVEQQQWASQRKANSLRRAAQAAGVAFKVLAPRTFACTVLRRRLSAADAKHAMEILSAALISCLNGDLQQELFALQRPLSDWIADASTLRVFVDDDGHVTSKIAQCIRGCAQKINRLKRRTADLGSPELQLLLEKLVTLLQRVDDTALESAPARGDQAIALESYAVVMERVHAGARAVNLLLSFDAFASILYGSYAPSVLVAPPFTTSRRKLQVPESKHQQLRTQGDTRQSWPFYWGGYHRHTLGDLRPRDNVGAENDAQELFSILLDCIMSH